jgi:putative peptide zinc metalloprotease protein
MYVEFLVAALAALVWAATPDGHLATVLHNTIVMGTVVTVFFNANPLMRFDGYFTLGDLLGIPNLASQGRAWFTQAVLWLLLGARRLRPGRPASRAEWIIALYGIAAWAWQILVFAGLLLAASAMLRGGGLLLAVIAGVAWIAPPVVKFLQQLAICIRRGMGRMMDPAVRLAVILVLAGLVVFSPYRKTVVALGVVEFGDTRIVRAECPGFVTRVHVRDGDEVPAGALLIELSNDEAAAALMKARRELNAQELRARMAYTRGSVAEYQAELARVDGLLKAVKENESYFETLRIRSPIAGRVHARGLHQFPGSWFDRGEEILRIGESAGREVKLAVGQGLEPHFKAALKRRVSVRIEGRGDVFPARLERLDGNASRTLPHAALTALAGGPLAVQRADDPARDARDAGQEHYELAEPHFGATVRITSASAAALDDGELARVRFRSPEKVTLWSEAHAAVSRWMRRHGA